MYQVWVSAIETPQHPFPLTDMPQRDTPSPWTKAGMFDKDLHPGPPMNKIAHTCEQMTCPQFPVGITSKDMELWII